MKKKKLLHLNKQQISKLTIINHLWGGSDSINDDTTNPTASNDMICPSNNCSDPISDPCVSTGTRPLGGDSSIRCINEAKMTKECITS